MCPYREVSQSLMNSSNKLTVMQHIFKKEKKISSIEIDDNRCQIKWIGLGKV